MAPGEEQVGDRGPGGPTEDLLDSWKDIASYLQRDVRTVMRWERSRRLPVHRLPGGRRAAIYALKSELEAWRAAALGDDPEGPGVEPASPAAAANGDTAHAGAPPAARPPAVRLLPALAVVLLVLAAGVAAILLVRPAWRGGGAAAPPIHALVVLPFANTSNDSAQDYVADGVHEALITDLARTTRASGLRVISHASAEYYRGRRVPARQIARELGVEAIVEGSVQRAGNRLLVSAQLVRAASDDVLWANRYERQMGDAFDLITEVSDAIRREVQTAVADTRGASRPPAARPVRPEALDAYLRARHAWESLTPGGLTTALALYQRALELDPGFALAWSGLALTKTAQAFISNAPSGDVLPQARDAARHALALDGNLAEAVGVLGYISLYWDWDFDAAGKTLARAVELNPGVTMVRHAYADYLMVTGDLAGSLEQVQAMRRNDPLSWPTRGILLYHALMARRYDDVVAEGRTISRFFPNRPEFHHRLAIALWLLGRRDQALTEWQQALGPGGVLTFRSMQEAYSRGDLNGVLSRLADWTVPLAQNGTQPAVSTASLYAAAGNRGRAFEWLELAFSRHEPTLLHLGADPLFDPIRSDPRFDALIRRIGIGRDAR